MDRSIWGGSQRRMGDCVVKGFLEAAADLATNCLADIIS